MTEHSDDEMRRRRLAWRCAHRGMKEMDLIFGGFVAANMDRFSDAELSEIERLSDLSDGEMLEWFMGRADVPADYDTPLVREIMAQCFAPADYSGS
ncbi:antitoxin CptB [Rhodoligotrophos appendicifer]|uniref:FAD assembly factor SdhE n=1 Tax=Rhodoligotrophos appendicifer TaxID=987056 RepID=UPI0014793644|nr:succinate dehydrogenase assembly factor 2 [Rhodoligotrophos appendicifer]